LYLFGSNFAHFNIWLCNVVARGRFLTGGGGGRGGEGGVGRSRKYKI